MKAFYKVHGFVQNVGYRSFVKRLANKYRINGFVKNISNGSVEIYAVGKEENIKEFEKEIEIRSVYGPNVLHIEKIYGNDADFPKFESQGDIFEIKY